MPLRILRNESAATVVSIMSPRRCLASLPGNVSLVQDVARPDRWPPDTQRLGTVNGLVGAIAGVTRRPQVRQPDRDRIDSVPQSVVQGRCHELSRGVGLLGPL